MYLLKVEKLQIVFKKEDNHKTNLFLEPLSFKQEEGQNIVLLGASGTGKSTVLKAILGTIPYSGTISFKPKLKYEFLLSENYFDLNETVLENFYYPLSLDNPHLKKKEVVSYLLKKQKKSTLKKAGECSFGTLRRLALYRSLFTCAELVFLDEPTLGCDKGKINLINDILKNNSSTYFIITHEPIICKNAHTFLIISDIFSSVRKEEECGFIWTSEAPTSISALKKVPYKTIYESEENSRYCIKILEKETFERTKGLLTTRGSFYWKPKDDLAPFITGYFEE